MINSDYGYTSNVHHKIKLQVDDKLVGECLHWSGMPICMHACTNECTDGRTGKKNTMLRWPIKSIKRKFMHFMDKILSLDDMLNEDPRSGYSK